MVEKINNKKTEMSQKCVSYILTQVSSSTI